MWVRAIIRSAPDPRVTITNNLTVPQRRHNYPLEPSPLEAHMIRLVIGSIIGAVMLAACSSGPSEEDNRRLIRTDVDAALANQGPGPAGPAGPPGPGGRLVLRGSGRGPAHRGRRTRR